MQTDTDGFLSLRRAYLETVPDKIADLERAARDPDALRRLAHRLHGTGGSYGFPEISQAAKELESAEAPEMSARLEELIAVLREAMASG